MEVRAEVRAALANDGPVQAALDHVMAQARRTTLTVAHRLSTIRDADKIAVVSMGAVVEHGNHDLLLSVVDGYYFNLVEAQQRL